MRIVTEQCPVRTCPNKEPGIAELSRTSLRRGILGCTLAFCVLINPAAAGDQSEAAHQEQQDILSRIVADWNARRERIPAVRYHLKGKRVWPAVPEASPEIADPGAPDSPPHPGEDVTSEFTRTVLLDFPNNRHRIEFDNPHFDRYDGTLYRIRCLHVCDGGIVYSRIYENSDPDLAKGRTKPHVDLLIQRGHLPVSVFTHDYLPLFLGHGIITYNDVRVRPGALTPSFRASDLTYHGTGTDDGRECIRIRTPKGPVGQREFWVDMARESAIVRIVDRPDAPVVRVDVHYRQSKDGWLVDGWTRTEFDLPEGGLRIVEEVQVEHIKLRPSLENVSFVINPEPGWYVEEERYYTDPQSGRYRSQQQIYRVEGKDDRVPLDRNLKPLARAPGGWTAPWRFLLGVNLLIIGLLIFWAWRRRRTSTKR